jgi:predicted DNA-binding transcriptional regulator AlpA
MEKIDTYINIKEVRKIVHLSSSSIYRLMKTNDFPSSLKFGFRNLWSLDALLAWLEEKKKATVPPK